MLQAVPTALRGAFQSCGQNCAGAERFLVQAPVYDRFVDAAAGVARRLRQGPALGDAPVDCGAMCMPGLAEKVAQLVEDAVADGAKVAIHTCVPALQHGDCCIVQCAPRPSSCKQSNFILSIAVYICALAVYISLSVVQTCFRPVCGSGKLDSTNRLPA